MQKDNQLPVWKDSYAKLGVSPLELYMRQQGLCWLKATNVDGEVVVFCTDGKDSAQTSNMLNPTLECSKCMSNFICKAIGKNDE